MNQSVVSKLGHALSALALTAVLSCTAALAGGAHSSASSASQAQATGAPVATIAPEEVVAAARSKFTIVDQQVTLSAEPTAQSARDPSAVYRPALNRSAPSTV